MEHKRKKQWILIIVLLLTVCSVLAVYAGREWMFTNPFKPYTFSAVSYASGDVDGCTYVIDDSNRKILKISADGKLLWRACASDKSFLSAERVVADGDGNVYLHDVRIEQGVQIASEGIVKLSSKGKYISTVASVEAEKGSVRRNIVGMVPTEHGVIYMQKEKEGILVSNTEQGSSKVFSVADAQDRILCCAYDRDSDSLFYVTYDGKIYKYTDSGQDELLYDSDTVDGSIPQEISYSDGVLYSADIGLRDIIRIPCDMENTGSTDRLTVEESLKEREIACRTGMDGRTFPPRSRAPAICLCIQWTYRCPNGICVSGFAGVVGESAVSAVRIDPAAVPRINEGIRRCANVAEMKWSLLPARNFCAGFLSAGRLFPDLPSRKNSLKALAIMRKI